MLRQGSQDPCRALSNYCRSSPIGELVIGNWTNKGATTKLVTEQVSHHPPITACYMSDEEHGISAEGYSRVEMTFDGSINIKQFGHATIHINEFDEDYLMPFPNVCVKGLLSGHLYPELVGNCAIVSLSGYVSEINFSGKGYFLWRGEYFQCCYVPEVGYRPNTNL
jgi:oxysterol-binding protein-related protein 9/10/11